MQPAPVRVGLLFDFPQRDGGSYFEKSVRIGFREVAGSGRLDRDVDLVTRLAHGLPGGTARAVEEAFGDLDSAGALAVLGPSISDNGSYVKDLADGAGLPCINYTGGEMTRSESMFHYQVGSLEEEPAVLAAHLKSLGLCRVAVVHDLSPVGHGYARWFEEARGPAGLEVVASAAVSPLSEDMSPSVERLVRAGADAVVYLGLGVAARSLALAMSATHWEPPVFANSALMFGYAEREWAAGWEGWTYLDTISDSNSARARLRSVSKSSAAGPLGVAAYDLGRLLGEAVARATHLTRDGMREGLERVKRLDAASGAEGTLMGFGRWERSALKGDFLVLRQWREGRSVEVPPR